MKRSLSDLLPLAACAVLVSCGDPTGSLQGGPDAIRATPSSLVIQLGATELLDLQLVDKQGNPLAANFTVASNNPAAVTIVQDASFRPGLGANRLTQRYQVTVNAVGANSVTVSSGGVNLNVPVTSSFAGGPVADLSANTSAVGDTISITLDPGLVFSQTSAVSFLPGGAARVVSVSADSLTLRFIAQPGSANAATITKVGSTFALPLQGSVVTKDSLTVPGLSAFPVAIAPASAALGDTVVLTAAAPFKFTPASKPITADPTLAIVRIGISADSSQLRFLPGPNFAATSILVDSTVVGTATALGRYTLTSAQGLTTPVVSSVPAVFSDATPDINQLVTVTASGFKFPPATTVSFNGSEQLVTSISADSNSLTFRAGLSGSGAVTFSNVLLASLTQVPLTLPSGTGITASSTILPLAGTDAIATAPAARVPTASGASATLTDGGPFASSADCTGIQGVPCRVYRIVSSGQAFDVSATWSNLADLGVYFTDAAGVDVGTAAACDAHGAGATAKPEACTVDVAAGTYYMWVVTFAAFYPPPNNVNPTSLSVTITAP